MKRLLTKLISCLLSPLLMPAKLKVHDVLLQSSPFRINANRSTRLGLVFWNSIVCSAGLMCICLAAGIFERDVISSFRKVMGVFDYETAL
jgi:hypothetical protein